LNDAKPVAFLLFPQNADEKRSVEEGWWALILRIRRRAVSTLVKLALVVITGVMIKVLVVIMLMYLWCVIPFSLAQCRLLL
jgi:hypothetical protein